jgi:hypothetical protein
MLTVDLTQVGYEEGILIADLAGILINGLNPALESLPDQLLRNASAMIDTTTQVIVETLKVLVVKLVFLDRRDSRRCHSLDDRSERYFAING